MSALNARPPLPMLIGAAVFSLRLEWFASFGHIGYSAASKLLFAPTLYTKINIEWNKKKQMRLSAFLKVKKILFSVLGCGRHCRNSGISALLQVRVLFAKQQCKFAESVLGR